MRIELNRREFLAALIALGASYALPSEASAREVDEAWGQAQADPWVFAVDQWGTISDAGHVEAATWGEVFDLGTGRLVTPADVIALVQGCQPLIGHFQALAGAEAQSLHEELAADPPPRLLRRRHIARVLRALADDPDQGWEDWVRLEGRAGVARFRAAIDDWLGEPVDFTQSEWFPLEYGSQGQAKVFFESLDSEVLEALQVVIVEGDRPGSTYYAAELGLPVEEANEVAAALGLPFRFRDEPV